MENGYDPYQFSIVSILVLLSFSMVKSQEQSPFCSENCINQTCGGPSMNQQECTYGCVDSFFGKRCLAKCPLPCLICSRYFRLEPDCYECTDGYYNREAFKDCIQCPEHCKTCNSSSNCTTCRDGLYDKDCNSTCSSNCHTCQRDDGKCVNCKAGFYGDTCMQTCSANCKDGVCFQSNGSCSRGCIDHFSGDKCCKNNNFCKTCSSNDICGTCVIGRFGESCTELCSKECGQSGCHKESGECFHCSGTRYGPFCENECPKGCSNLTGTRQCHKDSGECLDECERGYFGKHCDRECAATCTQLQCENTIGFCLLGCTSGYDGNFCEKALTEEDSDSPLLPIVGLVIGGIAVIGVVVLLGLHVLQRRNPKTEQQNEKQLTPQPQNVYDGLELSAVSVETGQYSDLDTAETRGRRA